MHLSMVVLPFSVSFEYLMDNKNFSIFKKILLLRVSSNRFEVNLGRNVLVHKIGKLKMSCLRFELRATFQWIEKF